MKKVFMLLGLLASLTVPAWAEEYKTGSEILELSESQPQFVVEYCADGCAWCQKAAPAIEAFEQAHPDIPVYKVKVEDSSFSRNLNLIHTPTFLVYRNGQLVRRWEGVRSTEQFEQGVMESGVITGDLCEIK